MEYFSHVTEVFCVTTTMSDLWPSFYMQERNFNEHPKNI